MRFLLLAGEGFFQEYRRYKRDLFIYKKTRVFFLTFITLKNVDDSQINFKFVSATVRSWNAAPRVGRDLKALRSSRFCEDVLQRCWVQ